MRDRDLSELRWLADSKRDDEYVNILGSELRGLLALAEREYPEQELDDLRMKAVTAEVELDRALALLRKNGLELPAMA